MRRNDLKGGDLPLLLPMPNPPSWPASSFPRRRNGYSGLAFGGVTIDVTLPLMLASYDVIRRTGNPLGMGESLAEGTPESMGVLMGFVYTHCAPWPEVVRASFIDQAFREAALIFCGALTPADFQTAFRRMEEQSRELEAAQVEPVSGRPGKMPVPATSRDA